MNVDFQLKQTEQRIKELFSQDTLTKGELKKADYFLTKWKDLSGWEENNGQVIQGITNESFNTN